MLKMSRLMMLAVVFSVVAMVLVACGAPATESAAPAAPQQAPEAARAMPAPAAPAPAAPAAPVAVNETAVEAEVVKEAAASDVGEFTEEQAALVAQNRIIVRTANLNLEVQNVANAIDAVSATAQQFGGWVVSSDRSSTHSGLIAIRVPSEQLDQAIRSIRGLSVRVLSEASTSEDVTDQYYDLRARLNGFEATRDRLLEILDDAYKVEDALSVHEEILEIQLEIESHQGRIKLLEQTAAFSLVNVFLNLAPRTMLVSGGGDRIISVGEPTTFRATFYAPPGIDYYEFTWDFGDGSPTVGGNGSVPTADGGRITATVNHVYGSDIDSPYIVEVKVTGTGDTGIVEGTDTFIADVSHIPTIEVFPNLNEDVTNVEEGKETVYSATFTRHEDLSGYKFEWDFGDGSPVVSGTPAEDATIVEASHVFANYRSFPFTVTLTVSADSVVGKEVVGTTAFEVYVGEDRGFVIGGWSAGDTLKDATRALSVLAQVVGTIVIWVATFSPVWIALGAVALALFWFRRRLTSSSRQHYLGTSGEAETQTDVREDLMDALNRQEGESDESASEDADAEPRRNEKERD